MDNPIRMTVASTCCSMSQRSTVATARQSATTRRCYDPVVSMLLRLQAPSRNGPHAAAKVDFVPTRAESFASSHASQDHELKCSCGDAGARSEFSHKDSSSPSAAPAHVSAHGIWIGASRCWSTQVGDKILVFNRFLRRRDAGPCRPTLSWRTLAEP